MLCFTPQERTVLCALAVIILTGSSLHYAFKKYPQLKDSVNLIESDRIYPKVDLNTASLDELISIPYIGTYTAQNIIQYRKENGLFTNIIQVKSVKGIRDKNYTKFAKYLKVNQNKPRGFVLEPYTNPRGLFWLLYQKGVGNDN